MLRTALDSTSLLAAAYQEPLALLELQFRSGALYRYFGVPASIYDGLLSAESKGRYFNSFIRKRFPFALIHPAASTPTSRLHSPRHQP